VTATTLRPTLSFLALPLYALLGCSLLGCAAGSQAPAHAPGGAAGDPARVEVWEAAEPQHEFVPTGDLWARTLSKPATIAKLREEAARFYMDGIFGVECKGPLHGECTATGFVYERTHAAGNVPLPSVAAAAPPAPGAFVYDMPAEREPVDSARRAGDRVVASR
jgi:hypothetical protein